MSIRLMVTLMLEANLSSLKQRRPCQKTYEEMVKRCAVEMAKAFGDDNMAKNV